MATPNKESAAITTLQTVYYKFLELVNEDETVTEEQASRWLCAVMKEFFKDVTVLSFSLDTFKAVFRMRTGLGSILITCTLEDVSDTEQEVKVVLEQE